MRRILLVSALTTCLVSSLSGQAPRGQAESVVLQPGDAVRITVWRKQELSGEFIVAADGSIKHPLYQRVKIAGIPLPAAEQQIYTFLKQLETDPQLVLEPLFRVTVAGEVREPNLYSLPPVTNIAQAVALAGGPTERGQLDRVRLVRHESETIVDLTRPDAVAAQMPIASGDQILVGRGGNFLRDIVVPVATMTAAVASIVSVFSR